MTNQVFRPKGDCKSVPFGDIRKGDKVVMHNRNDADLTLKGTVYSASGVNMTFQERGVSYGRDNWNVVKVTRKTPTVPSVDGLYKMGDHVVRVTGKRVTTPGYYTSEDVADDATFEGPLLTPDEAKERIMAALRRSSRLTTAEVIDALGVDILFAKENC